MSLQYYHDIMMILIKTIGMGVSHSYLFNWLYRLEAILLLAKIAIIIIVDIINLQLIAVAAMQCPYILGKVGRVTVNIMLLRYIQNIQKIHCDP